MDMFKAMALERIVHQALGCYDLDGLPGPWNAAGEVASALVDAKILEYRDKSSVQEIACEAIRAVPQYSGRKALAAARICSALAKTNLLKAP